MFRRKRKSRKEFFNLLTMGEDYNKLLQERTIIKETLLDNGSYVYVEYF